MKQKDEQREIEFLASMAKSIEGEITVSRLQSELKIGFQKANSVFNFLLQKSSDLPEMELVITSDEEKEIEKVINASLEAPPEITKEVPSLELAIVEAAVAPINLGHSLGEVLRDFDLGEHLTGCLPKEGIGGIKVGRALTVLTGVKNWSELGIGDLLNWLDDNGYKNVIPQIISALGLEDSYSTYSKYRIVARNSPNDLRELPGIHFSHLSEVCCSKFSSDPEEQKKIIREVLTDASERSLNVAQTREACLNRKGKSTPPTPAPVQKKHGRFIVIFPHDCLSSITCDELPDADEEHIVIDLEAASIACSGCSAGVPVWSPLVFEKLEATASETVIEE